MGVFRRMPSLTGRTGLSSFRAREGGMYESKVSALGAHLLPYSAPPCKLVLQRHSEIRFFFRFITRTLVARLTRG
jgi:hypothetical protein